MLYVIKNKMYKYYNLYHYTLSYLLKHLCLSKVLKRFQSCLARICIKQLHRILYDQ